MLIISRYPEQSVVIFTSDGPVVVKVNWVKDKRVQLAITAPDVVKIVREELLNKERDKNVS